MTNLENTITELADNSSATLDDLIDARDSAEGAAKTVLRKITKNVDRAFILLEEAEGMIEDAKKSGIAIT